MRCSSASGVILAPPGANCSRTVNARTFDTSGVLRCTNTLRFVYVCWPCVVGGGRGLNKWKQDGRQISVWKGSPLLVLLKYFMKPQQIDNIT